MKKENGTDHKLGWLLFHSSRQALKEEKRREITGN
jgi:hypothetical protein